MPLTQNRKGVYIAVLNQGEIRVELAQILIRMSARNDYNVYITMPGEKPISNNRNKIVLDFLKRKEFNYLLMLDGDIIPPVNLLEKWSFFKSFRSTPIIGSSNG